MNEINPDVLRDADELTREYGPAAKTVASERANFAFSRSDLQRQSHWISVFIVLRDRAQAAAALVAQ